MDRTSVVRKGTRCVRNRREVGGCSTFIKKMRVAFWFGLRFRFQCKTKLMMVQQCTEPSPFLDMPPLPPKGPCIMERIDDISHKILRGHRNTGLSGRWAMNVRAHERGSNERDCAGACQSESKTKMARFVFNEPTFKKKLLLRKNKMIARLWHRQILE